MTIGQRIKDKRIECGLSQEELAKSVSTTKQTIYKYEMGIVTNIPSDRIEAMAGVMNVSPAYLMGWEEPTPAAPELASDVRDLVTAYDKLNPTGRRKAREFVDDLTENPKYTAAAPTLSGELLTEMAHDLAKIPTNTK